MPRCISRPPRSSAQPEVLAAPADRADRLADDRLGRAAERPAQAACRRARAVTRAPRMRSAKLSRVTSTSGSSGMGGVKSGAPAAFRRALHSARGIITIGSGRMGWHGLRGGLARRRRDVVTLESLSAEESCRCRRFALLQPRAGPSPPCSRSSPDAPRRRRRGRRSRRRAGRELGPRRAALLSAAARRDRAARRRGRHRLPADARRRTAHQGRAAVPARHRDRAAGARRRPGARRRASPGARRCPIRTDALRYQIQLLVALNRVADVDEPLGALAAPDGAAGAAGD